MRIITDCRSVVIPDDVYPTLVLEDPGFDPFSDGAVLEGSIVWWSNGVVTVGTVLDGPG